MQFSITSDCFSPPGTSASGKKGTSLSSLPFSACFHLPVSPYSSDISLTIQVSGLSYTHLSDVFRSLERTKWEKKKKSIFLRYLLGKTRELASFCVPTISCHSRVTILVVFRKLLEQNLAKSYYTHILILL